MNSLILKKNKYGLKVYSTKEKKWYNDSTISNSNYPEYQHYKSSVTDGNRTRVKTHKTRVFDEALVIAIEFKRDIKKGINNIKTSNPYEVEVNSISIKDSANLYLNFKHNINVPSQLHKELSKSHLSHIKCTIKGFIQSLEKKGFNCNAIPIAELNDYHVSHWYDYITENYKKGGWRTLLKILNAWVNYLIKHHNLSMANPFSKVVFEVVEHEIKAITKNEFDEVIKAIDTKNPYKYLGGKGKERKRMFRPYLADGFKLGLMLGLRREELVTLQWNDLKFNQDSNELIIVTDNLKVERSTGKKYKKKYIPVYPQLKSLLDEMGFDELKGSCTYILHPLRGSLRTQTMMDALSKGFSHYYKQAFPDRETIMFKVLRKTYLSYLNKAVGDNMIDLSSHSGMEVVQRHYLDKELTAKGYDMKVF
jgi:integrase